MTSLGFEPLELRELLSVTPTVTVSDGGVYTSAAQAATALVNNSPSLEGVTPVVHYYAGTSATGNNWTTTAPVQVGTYSVLASFAGSTDYTSAQASATFSITRATPTVSATDAGGTATGWVTFPATAKVAGVGSQSSPYTTLEGTGLALTYYSGTSTTGAPLSGAPTYGGTYTVVASFAGSADYVSAVGSTSFSVAGDMQPMLSVSDGGPFTGAAQPATVLLNGGSSLEGVTPVVHYFTGTSATGNNWTTTPPLAVGTYAVLASFAGSTHYISAQASAIFSITPARPTVSVSDAGGVVNGSQTFPATATVNGSSSLAGITPSLTYYSGTAVTGSSLSGAPSAAGSYTVLASFAGNVDYASAAASTTFTISRQTPSVSVTDNGGIYTGAAYPATDSVNGGSSLEGATPSLAYYSGTSASGSPVATAPSLAGTYTVVATFPGSADYASGSASTTFTISQIVPGLSVSDTGGAYSGATFPATASINDASSLEGGTISLAYYSGTAVSGTALGAVPSTAGTYSVLASFAGTTDYTSAVGSTTFSITQAPPLVTVTDAGGTLNGSPYPATDSVNGSSSLEGVTPTLTYYSGGSTTGTSSATAPSLAGTYTVVASFAGSTDYTSGIASATFTIGQVAPTILVSDGGGAYSGAAFPASDSVNGGSSLEGVTLTLTYYSGSSTTGTSSATAPSTAGTYTVVASFPGSADYGAAAASTAFTISQLTPSVSVTDAGGPFTGSSYSATASVNSGGSLEGVTPTFVYYSGSSVSGSPSATAPSMVGTYTTVASFAGSADYTSANSNPVTFSISKVAPSISLAASSATYTDAAIPVTAGPIEGVTSSVTYYAGTSATGTPLSGAPSTLGTYTALASFAGSTDYTSATACLTFSIAAATPSLTVTDNGGVYSGAAFPATDAVAGVGSQSAPAASLAGVTPTLKYYAGGNTTGSSLSTAPSTAGTFTAVASMAASADYTSASASTTFTVSKARPTILVTDAGGAYNHLTYPATASVAGIGSQSTAGNFLENVGLTFLYYSGTAATGSPLATAPSLAGTYQAVASFAGSTDYAASAGSTTVVITPITPTVTVSDPGGVYSGKTFAATALVAGASSLEGVAPTISYYSGSTSSSPLAGAPSSAGSYVVVANFPGSTDYAGATASASFTISKAAATVTVSETAGSPYTVSDTVAGVGSQASPASSLEGVSPTLVYYTGASATGTPLGSQPTAAGTYTVVASFAGSTDYNTAHASTTFTVAKAAPVISVVDNGGVYNTQPFAATVTAIEGVTPTASYYSGSTLLASPPSTVGSYRVVGSFAGSADYTSGTVTHSFSITQATPTVIATDAGGTYDAKAYAATASVAGAGSQSTPGSSLEGATLTLHYYTGTSGTGNNWSTTAPVATGTYTVVAVFPGTTDYATTTSSPVTFTIVPDPLIAITSGNNQSAGLNSAFAQQLAVTVTDAAGNPLSGALVTFTLPASGASGTFAGGLTTVVVATNSAGLAVAPLIIANGTAGTFTVTASTPGEYDGLPASFTLTNL